MCYSNPLSFIYMEGVFYGRGSLQTGKLKVEIKASICGNIDCYYNIWNSLCNFEGCCSNEIRYILKVKALAMYIYHMGT